MQAHASIIEELLANAMLAGRQSSIVDQLQTALENRVTIDRATGVVMALHDVDPSAAFQAMRLDARSRRLRIAEYAEQVVRTRKFPLPADLDLQ
jgi:AmiR/NasT family two-component response regulator